MPQTAPERARIRAQIASGDPIGSQDSIHAPARWVLSPLYVAPLSRREDFWWWWGAAVWPVRADCSAGGVWCRVLGEVLSGLSCGACGGYVVWGLWGCGVVSGVGQVKCLTSALQNGIMVVARCGGKESAVALSSEVEGSWWECPCCKAQEWVELGGVEPRCGFCDRAMVLVPPNLGEGVQEERRRWPEAVRASWARLASFEAAMRAYEV